MARPSPLACIECRQHHLKCDAKIPSCSRCSETGLICKYLPSRRGRNRRARDGHRQGSSSGGIPVGVSVGGSHGNSINLPGLPNMSNTGKGHDALPAVSEEPAQPHGLVSDIQTSNSDTDTRLVRLFYENFHSAHPILVPAFEYEKRRYPPFLQQVVRFIGSHYSLQISRDSLRRSTATLLFHPSDGSGQRTPSMVQALLLYSIMLCARGEIGEAQTAFSRALDIAFELGMHRREFAMYYSDSREVEAESLRRTWWELTIVEVFMAALQKKVALRCGSVPYDVGLPCEESVYANTNINMIPSSPPTLASFSRRMFTEDDDGEQTRYSSFSYRIEAACILARVLVLNSLPETHHDHLQAVENALVSWTNLLPPSKVDVVDTYGVVDEMLFQAHTTIQYAAMLLHLPRSNLRPAVPTSNTNTNTNTEHPETQPHPHPQPEAPPATIICPTTPSRLSPSFTRHVHDTKATEASKQLSNLLSMRPSVQRYTPFIICGLALCGMVQLATSRIHAPDCAEHHRNRVVLVLGCLKVLRRNWAIADQAYHHVRMAAAEVFAGWAGSTRCFQTQAAATVAAGSGAGAGAGAGAGNPSVGVKNSPPSSRRASTAGAAEWVNAGGGDAVNPEVLSPGLLSAYIDPTCSDPSFLNNIFDLDFT